MKAVLYTRGDRGRLGALVAEFEIPEFVKAPEILLWGSRAFTIKIVTSLHLCYTEATAYSVPT